jgi:MurNAc alpha-1-phosphate uridylyltransferase
MIKKAMIMAAGLGTRMKPLTENKPKALLTYRGITLLQGVIERLMAYDFNDIIINVHHHGDQIIRYMDEHRNFGASIMVSDERDRLLDTGGGLLKASPFFGSDPFLVYNVDILTDLDLDQMWNSHRSDPVLATLAVKHRNTSRSLLMNEKQILCGWRNNLTGEEIISRQEERLLPIAFSGIYILDPLIFRLFKKSGSFPVMPEFLRIAGETDIRLFVHDESSWKDMGKPESYRN